jgi:hypothetical protein
MVFHRWSKDLDLKVLRTQAADVDTGIVRIPHGVRGDRIRRGHWYRVSHGGKSVVVQVFGTKHTDPIITMDMTLRNSLGVTTDDVERGGPIRFQVSPVGLCGEIWSGWRRHPDVSIRVSTFLGLLSVALAIAGIVLGLVSVVPRSLGAG